MSWLMQRLEFAAARRDPDSGYPRHGRWFADPYAWLDRLDDPEAQAWIVAQEAVTRGVLQSVPGRDRMRDASAGRHGTRDCPRRSRSGRTGGSSSGRPTSARRSSSSCCGRVRVRRWSRCSTRTAGRLMRRWSSLTSSWTVSRCRTGMGSTSLGASGGSLPISMTRPPGACYEMSNLTSMVGSACTSAPRTPTPIAASSPYRLSVKVAISSGGTW